MDENLRDMIFEAGEVALDSLLDDGVLRDIPILGQLVGLAKASRSIPDRIFRVKVERFAAEADKVDPKSRAAFIAQLQSDPETQNRAGEAIVLALERIDSIAKAEIIGKVFCAFVEQRIQLETLRRLLAAVDRAILDDLLKFPDLALATNPTLDAKAVFADLDGTGLVFDQYPRTSTHPPKYAPTDLGLLYAKIIKGLKL